MAHESPKTLSIDRPDLDLAVVRARDNQVTLSAKLVCVVERPKIMNIP